MEQCSDELKEGSYLIPFLDQPKSQVQGQGPLTKREELSFRKVLALPKASRAGLAWMIWSSRVPCEGQEDAMLEGSLFAVWSLEGQ